MGLPAHAELNATVLLAHAACRFAGGMPPAECARRAGFNDVDEFRRYCMQHTGEEFTEFVVNHGMPRSIERLDTWLCERDGSVMIPIPACCL
jgi:hypothetical protein